MDGSLQRAKQPASAMLTGPYGHPFHPMLVTLPIGAWICSLVFDIAAQFVEPVGFLARGSEWLIAIGVVGALGAASVGFLDLMGIRTGTRAFRTGLLHMSAMLTVTVAYILNFVWRLGSATDGGSVPIGPLVLSIVSVVALAAGGTLGGRLAYRFGVRVADEGTQAEGFVSVRRAAADVSDKERSR